MKNIYLLISIVFLLIETSYSQTRTLRPANGVDTNVANVITTDGFAIWWDKDNTAMAAEATTVSNVIELYRQELLSYDMKDVFTISSGYYLNVYLYQPGVDDFQPSGWGGTFAAPGIHAELAVSTDPALGVSIPGVRHELFHCFDLQAGNFRGDPYSQWAQEGAASWYGAFGFPPSTSSDLTGSSLVVNSNYEIWAFHGLYPGELGGHNYQMQTFINYLSEAKAVDKSILVGGGFNQHTNTALHSIHGEFNISYWSRMLGNNGQTFRDYYAEYAGRTVNNFDYLPGTIAYDWTTTNGSLEADFDATGSNGWFRPTDANVTRNTSFNTYRIRNTDASAIDYEFKIKGDATSTNGLHASRFMGTVVLKNGGVTTFHDITMQAGDLEGAITLTVPSGAEAFLVVVSVPDIIREVGNVFSHEIYIDTPFSTPTIGFDGTSVSEVEDGVCDIVKEITIDVLMYTGANVETHVLIQEAAGTTAQSGDYAITNVGSIVSFPAGSTATQTVTIDLYRDFFIEGNETIVLELVIASAGSNAQIESTIGTYTINLIDNDDVNSLVISGPSDITSGSTSGMCGATVNYADPTSNVICSLPLGSTANIVQLTGLASGSVFPIGITTNTFEVTNDNGDKKQHSFSVTVHDTEAPIAPTANGDIVVNNEAGSCTAVVNYSLPSFTDSCGTITTPLDVTSIEGYEAMGSFEGHTYFVSNHIVTAQQAHDEAAKYGGYLVAINSWAENNFVYDYIHGTTTTFTWLGFKNLESDNDFNSFTWITGEPNTFVNFATASYYGDYAYMPNYYSRLWFTAESLETQKYHYIIEIDAGITRTEGLASGEAFPVGTTTVTHQYKDIGGNTASYSFDVTVNDNDSLCSVNVSPKVYLQGAAINPNTEEETLMRDDLRVAGIIPTTSPYADNLTCDISVFSATGSDAIVDWIWLELRDETNATLAKASRSALLQRDGDIVDIDGVSPVKFFNTLAGNFNLVIDHRNHLAVMNNSNSPLSLTNTSQVIDFSNGGLGTFGSNAQTTSGMPSGVIGLWAGNADGSSAIQYSGANPESTQILSYVLNSPSNFLGLPSFPISGYSDNDVNMDGQTQYTGSAPELPLILQNVLTNPENFLSLPSWPINERLPEN